jgi:hypothetical protein
MRGSFIRTSYLVVIMAVAVACLATAGYGSTSAQSTSPLPPPQTRLDLTGGPSAFLHGMSRISGEETPQLMLAQRSIDRSWNSASSDSVEDPSAFSYVEVDGWKSVVGAGGLSFIFPGTGQLYVGEKYGFVMMGIQAVALYSFFHFKNESQSIQNEAFSYAGNPNVSGSLWSFERYEAEEGREAAEDLREIYTRDPVEFYSKVSSDADYFSGWQGSGQDQIDNVVGYRTLDEERKGAAKKSNFGLYTAIVNTIVSTVDAVRAANLNNFKIQQNLNLEMQPKLGHDPGLTAILTHNFH